MDRRTVSNYFVVEKVRSSNLLTSTISKAERMESRKVTVLGRMC